MSTRFQYWNCRYFLLQKKYCGDFHLLSLAVSAVPIREEGHKFAGYLAVVAILVSLPAFVSLYLHIRRTNLGHLLFQPFLAMFVGFFGVMLNSLIDMN